LAGIGQTSTNLVGQAGQNYATNVGNLMTGGAAAQAAGQVGQANALTSGLSTYLNYSQNNALLNALQRNQNMQLVNTGGYSNVPSYMVQPPGGG
jgi:flagellar basal body P-ring protein FlgI